MCQIPLEMITKLQTSQYVVCKKPCIVIATVEYYLQYTDPAECQDGITHNCTHECTRSSSDGESSYECSCKHGYVPNENNTNLCDGEFDVL